MEHEGWKKNSKLRGFVILRLFFMLSFTIEVKRTFRRLATQALFPCSKVQDIYGQEVSVYSVRNSKMNTLHLAHRIQPRYDKRTRSLYLIIFAL